MKLMNQARFYGRMYRDEAGEGGGDGEGGDGGSDGNAITPEQFAEVQSQLEKMQAENERLNGKITEANKHNKEAQRKAAEEARKKAEAEGNFEQLFQSSETERASLAQQLEDLQSSNAKKEKDNAALKLAGELAEGANVALLAEFIGRRLKYTDEGIKVTDESGNLTVSTLDALKTEFAGSATYSSLIKGNQSSGGGASGGSNGGSATAETISRDDFNARDPASRMKFIKDGGKVID